MITAEAALVHNACVGVEYSEIVASSRNELWIITRNDVEKPDFPGKLCGWTRQMLFTQHAVAAMIERVKREDLTIVPNTCPQTDGMSRKFKKHMVCNSTLTYGTEVMPDARPTHFIHFGAIKAVRDLIMPDDKLTVKLSREAHWQLVNNLPDRDRLWLSARIDFVKIDVAPRYDVIDDQWTQRFSGTPEYEAAMYEDADIYDGDEPQCVLRFARVTAIDVTQPHQPCTP